MAWLPISFTAPQYLDSNGDPYSGAVLKFYQAGTSTNTNMATDSTGGTTLADVVLDSNGYPSNGGSIFIPHIDQAYKLALYPTEAAADADTGAIWSIDNLAPADLTDTDTDEKSKVSSNDTTAGYLNGKLVGGTDISLTEGSDGGDETLTIALDQSGYDLDADTLIGKTTRRVKTADESVSSPGTTQDDDHLSFPIAANEIWCGEAHLFAGTDFTAHGFASALNAPTGATIRYSYAIITNGDDTTYNTTTLINGGISSTAAGFAAGTAGHIILNFWVSNGANAGTVQVRWGQGTSSATPLTIYKGSWLVARQLA